MLTVCTLIWDKNKKSQSFSCCYDDSWVMKLYWGFRRHLHMQFRFVLYTDRNRPLPPFINQVIHSDLGRNGYSDCVRPYEMNVPMILTGLDTVVTGDCSLLGGRCMVGRYISLPRDPYRPLQACNGVALVPAGHRDVAVKHRGQNDMDWVRKFRHEFLDDIFPGKVVSYKGHVEKNGLGDARIVYFHGKKKPHELGHLPWIQEHWNGVGSVHSRILLEAKQPSHHLV